MTKKKLGKCSKDSIYCIYTIIQTKTIQVKSISVRRISKEKLAWPYGPGLAKIGIKQTIANMVKPLLLMYSYIAKEDITRNQQEL